MIYPFSMISESMRITRMDKIFADPLPGAVVAIDVPGVSTADAFDRLARRAVEIAADEIGHGETEGNNRGEWIRMYCAPNGDGHEWCAAFAGWCYDKASVELAIPLPFKRSLGAKRLGKNVAAAGKKLTKADIGRVRAGDLVVWHRGPKGSWSGHVALVERVAALDVLQVIEGNSGANVRRMLHHVDLERFAFIASVRP